ncbi:hypothetical protein P869_08895 [Ligilactobacillus ruminis S23]|nr:hypothetical protein ANHS_694 [Ligilactobacillus ruminis ATCC 25644]KLA46893.1 hypothetical protein P869_08895 [Ligilactobacillus ruminis S23]
MNRHVAERSPAFFNVVLFLNFALQRKGKSALFQML